MVLIRDCLIIGDSPSARTAAQSLLIRGFALTWLPGPAKTPGPQTLPEVPAGNGSLEVLDGVRLRACAGSPGNYTVSLTDDRGQALTRRVAAVLLSPPETRRPNYALYGLQPSASVTALGLARQCLASPATVTRSLPEGSVVLFLTGILEESNPVIAAEVMQAALTFRTALNCRCYVLTGNLKVAGDGLEELYRQNCKAGTVFVKFQTTLPVVRQKGDDRLTVEFTDEISETPCRLAPDLTVVDERIAPSDDLEPLARIFALDRDPAGFLQADNVHRLPNYTNRAGILVAGPARSVQSPHAQALDGRAGALAVLGSLTAPPAAEAKAHIDPGRCIRCLTCYRLCPHGAVQRAFPMAIAPEACERCGICVVACPRGAIHLELALGYPLPLPATAAPDMPAQGVFTPRITVFCCSRSARMAGEQARCGGHRLPAGLRVIELPCAGHLDQMRLLTALRDGADGVLALTCHEGNCHSEGGNLQARRQTARLQDLLPQIGLEKERLALDSLAANMGAAFAAITRAFEKRLQALGPNPLAGAGGGPATGPPNEPSTVKGQP